MSAAALSRPSVPEDAEAPPPALSDAPLTLRLFNTMAAAEPAWRRLEEHAVLTPYQRFDWIAGWLKACGGAHRLAILVIEQAGDPVALLPLEIDRRLGLRQASMAGTAMGNADFMVVRPGAAARLTRDVLAGFFAEARKQAGIDFIALFNQPESWTGVENPLLGFAHQTGPNNLYLGSIDERGTFARLDEKRLGNLARRKRKLGDAHGAVVLKAATTPEEVTLFHETFLKQRAARFAQMGIANIFAEPHFVRFFRDTAIASLGARRPAMVMHALFAGDEIVGTACGTFAGGHYSQYINATAGGDAAKFRLIGILMHELFNDVAARGGTSIDMGLGDFDYKTDWTVPTPVYDAIIPLTLRGRLAGSAILGLRQLKRSIKQHDRLWGLVRRLRAKLLSRQTVPPSAPPAD
jgi:CelD/BcsL family acetyltransferase involved in cellulose biosynthesis